MNLLCFISPDGEECSVEPIACSKYKFRIEDYKNSLLTESEKYDAEFLKFEQECKRIIRTYLLTNYDAITGWNDVRDRLDSPLTPDDKQKNKIIEFLCDNYRYSLGKSILETPYQDDMIRRYCDIKKLRKPYPTLPQCPYQPVPYYKRKFLEIIEVKDLDQINEK